MAIVLAVGRRVLTLSEAFGAWVQGLKSMMMAIVILVLAWSIGAATTELQAAAYLVQILEGALDPAWLPVLTFVIAAAMAFATGTSWATMAIMMPLVIPLADALSRSAGLGPERVDTILVGVIASVLAGAVFGDHCSPISDTTILSSMASASDHIDHVRTQLPYAMLVGVVGMVNRQHPDRLRPLAVAVDPHRKRDPARGAVPLRQARRSSRSGRGTRLKTTRLGSTGLEVSRLCLGCMTYGDPDWRPWILGEAEARTHFEKAFELGFNFFDTADMYSKGVSEEVTGKILKELAHREDYVLATKCFFPLAEGPNRKGLSRKHIIAACDDSLRRLGHDYVDLYQIHRLDHDTPDGGDRGSARLARARGQGALPRGEQHGGVGVRDDALPRGRERLSPFPDDAEPSEPRLP